MKTRFLQYAALALLLCGPGLASAADAPKPQETVAPASAQTADGQDRLAWQRVGAPETLQG